MWCKEHRGTRSIVYDVRIWTDCRSPRRRSVIIPGLLVCGLITWLPCGPGCQASGRVPGSLMPAADPPVAELERSLFSMLNRDRARRRLPPLVFDPSLARIARDHSAKMADLGILGHDLPPSGDLKARLSRAGYVVRKARENVACAGTIEQAESAFLKSPGHLENITAADVSHVGIGIARGSGSHADDLYITQIFADPATRPKPEQLRRTQLTRIEETRRRSGLKPLRVDPLFDKTASRLLGSLGCPFDAGDLERLLDEATAQIPQGTLNDVSRISLDVQLVHDERDLKVSDDVRRARTSVLGTAAREFRDARGQLVVAILTLIGSR